MKHLITMLMMILLSFTQSQYTNTVTVTGFDNHNQLSIAKEVGIPVTNVDKSLYLRTPLDKHTRPRLCRHVTQHSVSSVSQCWPGLDCNSTPTSSNGEDAQFSYHQFVDTCVGGKEGYCTTKFVTSCTHLEQQIGVESRNREGGEVHEDIIETELEENKIINNGNMKRRLVLGLKTNKFNLKEKKRKFENAIVDVRHEIIKDDINPNIIVNYLNKHSSNEDDKDKNPIPNKLPRLDLVINQ